MDEIGSIVAEAIARRAKAALAQQAQNAQPAQTGAQSAQNKGMVALQRRAQYGDKQAQTIIAKLKSAGLTLPGATAPAPPPVVAAPPPPPPPAPPAAAAPDVAPAPDGFDVDALPGLPTKILDGMSVERPMLLTAFTSDGILPAIVFAEALAKPLALREGGPGSSF